MRPASSRSSLPGRPTGRTRGTPAPALSSPPPDRTIVSLHSGMSARRSELTRAAARLFAERGYHGTSIGDLAEALGVQKASLYHHFASKQDLLYETMRSGAAAFHGALDSVPEAAQPSERIRLAMRAHLRVVDDQ